MNRFSELFLQLIVRNQYDNAGYDIRRSDIALTISVPICVQNTHSWYNLTLTDTEGVQPKISERLGTNYSR
jgi:hypothetical protein